MEVKGIQFQEESGGQWCQMLLRDEGQGLKKKSLDLVIKKIIVTSSRVFPLLV